MATIFHWRMDTIFDRYRETCKGVSILVASHFLSPFELARLQAVKSSHKSGKASNLGDPIGNNWPSFHG